MEVPPSIEVLGSDKTVCRLKNSMGCSNILEHGRGFITLCKDLETNIVRLAMHYSLSILLRRR